jgi:hypothetical protein
MWADSVRFKRPVLHNDYQALPDRAGYPAGHAHLVRHLGVPLVENGVVHMLMGVGNKSNRLRRIGHQRAAIDRQRPVVHRQAPARRSRTGRGQGSR